MNSSKRWKLWCCAVMGIMLWSAGLYKMDGRLTYIERSRINEESVQSIAVTDHETVLEQELPVIRIQRSPSCCRPSRYKLPPSYTSVPEI